MLPFGRTAEVLSVGFYHGGDVLYQLDGCGRDMARGLSGIVVRGARAEVIGRPAPDGTN